MKGNLKLSARAWIAVCFVVVLYAAIAITGKNPLAEFFLLAVAFSTAGIAALDSMQVQLRRYRSGIAYGPVGLFLACSLFWPVALIWYFFVRVRIARGTMPLKDEICE